MASERSFEVTVSLATTANPPASSHGCNRVHRTRARDRGVRTPGPRTDRQCGAIVGLLQPSGALWAGTAHLALPKRVDCFRRQASDDAFRRETGPPFEDRALVKSHEDIGT